MSTVSFSDMPAEAEQRQSAGLPPKPMLQRTTTQSIYCSATARTFNVVEGQIPPALLANLQRDFTAEEVETIFTRANQRTAPRVPKPAALWIFGPSAVGKTFITGAKANHLFHNLQNAVVVDGTELREAHMGFQAVAVHGQEHGVLHADAWPSFKKYLDEAASNKVTLKRRLMHEALKARQNLVIPDCANNPKRLQELIEEVRSAGYQMHAVCLWAPLSMTRARGEERSVREGKLWTPKDYDISTRTTLSLAMRWIDGMRDEPSTFCSLELWDNTQFPATELGLEQYASLVQFSHEEADEHMRKLLEARRNSHAHTAAGNAKARDELGKRKSLDPFELSTTVAMAATRMLAGSSSTDGPVH
jgi:hypothetical protein